MMNTFVAVLAAGGYTDVINGRVLEWQNMVKGAFNLGAIVVVGVTYFKTKALVATVGAMLLAGLVLWGVNSTDWFQTKTGEEIQRASVLVVPGGEQGSSGARLGAVLVMAPTGGPHGR